MALIFLRDAPNGDTEATEVDSQNPFPVKVIADATSGVKDTAVSVNTTAILLPSVPLSKRQTIAISNNGTAPIFIGGPNVTTVTGTPVTNGGSISLNAGPGVAIYGISTAAQDVRVLELA